MTRLSVNINKVATLRNARGGNVPDVVRFARDCESYGAQGITVHPRPDERHIRRTDVYALKEALSVEFNIEGNPTADFTRLVLDVCPAQVTLVPDSAMQLTSDHGWDTIANAQRLGDLIAPFREKGIRVSVFVDPDAAMVEGAARVGADRVELYTGPYAKLFEQDPRAALDMYRDAALAARDCGLGLNAGHDLTTTNLSAFVEAFPWTDEVSIGHQLIADALYWGIERTINEYLRCLRQ